MAMTDSASIVLFVNEKYGVLQKLRMSALRHSRRELRGGEMEERAGAPRGERRGVSSLTYIQTPHPISSPRGILTCKGHFEAQLQTW